MNLWFPLNLHLQRGLPINAHQGAFGALRKYDIHQGIDLYGSQGDWVYAMTSGTVVLKPPFTGPNADCPWWLPTDAVIVEDHTGYWVYGELTSPLQVGDKVQQGQKIGELMPVNTPDKIRPDIPGHSNVMLHLERWNMKRDLEAPWKVWTNFHDRPDHLEDPTPYLIQALNRRFQKIEFLTI